MEKMRRGFYQIANEISAVWMKKSRFFMDGLIFCLYSAG
uniref:Uncharacterized protein n=1 Tax=Rheinheimera sp. BAL341 TaxID=1708203 RepID=A0A486XJ84_9GAMM